jgi:hypothetical protein
MGSDAEHRSPGEQRHRPLFAHPSEAEFAGILDFYGLAWQYEPRTFPLRYASDGRVTESFTPDFYLPEFDLFIELTTLKQSLVTKKNRKLRRLRELYPEVKIKLLYNRDYHRLRFKYGLLDAEEVPAATPGAEPATADAPASTPTPPSSSAPASTPTTVTDEVAPSPPPAPRPDGAPSTPAAGRKPPPLEGDRPTVTPRERRAARRAPSRPTAAAKVETTVP